MEVGVATASFEAVPMETNIAIIVSMKEANVKVVVEK